MENSHLFLNAMTYVAFIILSGLSLLICLILFIIRVSQDHKQKWNWLIAAVISVLTLLFSVYLLTRKVVSTVKNIGESVEQKFEESIEELKKQDSSYNYTLLQTNTTIKQLKEFEQFNNDSNAPNEFYVYFGYLDYYRMPITYPFSIHCNDILETGALYNEKNVVDFNVNDNGEINSGLENITAFAFDNAVLISKHQNPKNKSVFYVYEFSSNKKTECTSLKEAFKIARKQYNYRGYDTLITIRDYYQLFN